MGMVFVVVVDPFRRLLQHSEGVRTRLDPRVIAFEGFDEGLAGTVAYRAAYWGEKGY
jgi:hypothetical protein